MKKKTTLSKYNNTENLKITYLLGAGASFDALPIWNKQGDSMISLANEMISELTPFPSNDIYDSVDKEKLLKFFNELKMFGERAVEYGSIDIYAKRLYLLNNIEELNLLKKCVSIYFDLWEANLASCSNDYQTIDKRFFSLLSIILEKESPNPEINSNISFITWNYDLQLEMAYDSFLFRKSSSIEKIDEILGFSDGLKQIIHLNGHRGIFKSGDTKYDVVPGSHRNSLQNYLRTIAENNSEFRKNGQNFNSSIKYAWEMSSDAKSRAKEMMAETNILIIVGYSFPAFNRKIDRELIEAFEKSSGYKRVVYQDPNANQELIDSLFLNTSNIEIERLNMNQFYIPHEFLSPSKGESIVF